MLDRSAHQVWFVTGSQHLYGPEVLDQVAAHSRQIAHSFSAELPVQVVFKPVLTTPDAIRQLVLEANAYAECVCIDGATQLPAFKKELRWNEAYYCLARGV